ncbi:Aste57867_10024 [Aphanomyces stellatus]|uniref:Aste57867_10024 protein n=1 Tax=Aphanomyces stellatus TaxID=120398 RepID=A0A485KPB3_9STRA|nr:hypothetical protein As57867_009985 [Aphanomyces stellatus]VFT86902.1 Aste57867_10024 [Aphanomyces stellatus]
MPKVVYDVGAWRLTEDGRIYRHGKLRFANGDMYDGEWVDGKRQGRGTFVYADGSRFTGEMVENLFHGFGSLVVADKQHPFTGEWIKGSTYEGYFVHGKKHGKGLIVYGEGGSYDGEFQDNVFSGRGIRCYKNGDRYDGEWRHGEWWGTGEWRGVDGASYTGEFQSGRFHHSGAHVFAHNLGTYDGAYRSGLQHGKGKRVFADISTYDGEWIENVMHGNGVWTTAAFTYIGDFAHGWPHGHGLYTFVNGDVYEGPTRQGYFYGHGKYTYKDGSWYDGEYTATTLVHAKARPAPDGLKHGRGTRQWVNGNAYEGTWANDVMDGRGVLQSKLVAKNYSLRMEYDGEFKGGLQTGQGTLRVWNPRGERIEFPAGSGNWYGGKGTCTYVGMFLRGEFHGHGELMTCDGRRYVGEWQRGKRHGLGTADLIPVSEVGDEERMHIKGCNALYRIAKYEGMHCQDHRHGVGTAYFSNGDGIEGEFKLGHIDGVATYIYTSGKRRRGTWKMGARVSWASDEEQAKWNVLEKTLRRRRRSSIQDDVDYQSLVPQV